MGFLFPRSLRFGKMKGRPPGKRNPHFPNAMSPRLAFDLACDTILQLVRCFAVFDFVFASLCVALLYLSYVLPCMGLPRVALHCIALPRLASPCLPCPAFPLRAVPGRPHRVIPNAVSRGDWRNEGGERNGENNPPK
jgi:hypothetical protein